MTATDTLAPERPAEAVPRADAEFLSSTLERLVRRHQVPGAQLAVHHQGETTALEVGELEHRSGLEVTGDTAVPIGSITKCFTATVAMILVADGDLELDEPVADHLPELAEWGEELTLRRLLSHTSGLAAGPEPQEAAGQSTRRYLRDHCRPRDLVLPPGTGFSYSNPGYVVAGRLIEEITGMAWDEAVASILLQPLGIAPAFVDTSESVEVGRPVATGHSVNRAVGRTRPVRQSLPRAEWPAGAVAASALDLVALARLHLGEGMSDLLPADVAELMRRPVPDAEPFGLADGWGLGLAVFDEGGTEWIGHDGNAEGTSCYLRADPDGGWAVALTSNATTGAALWRDLLEELARTDVPIGPPRAVAVSGEPVRPWRGVAGSYVTGSTEYVLSRDGDGSLSLVIDGDAVPLVCYDDLTFGSQDPITGRCLIGGRVLTDAGTGRIEGIQVDGRVARRAGQPARIVA